MRLLLAVLFLLSEAAVAQGSFVPRNKERAGTWDVSLLFTQQSSLEVGGQQGTGIDFDSESGFGFGFSYNFSNHLSLGGDFLFARPKYEGRFVDENDQPFDISNKASFFTGQVRGTWNILPGDLTPYIEGALGWTHVDSNVVDGPPVTGCWWDPWWGYICRPFYSTYNESNFSYSIGVGGRWDITPEFGMRAGYTRQVIDLSNTTSDPEFDVFRIDLIFRN